MGEEAGAIHAPVLLELEDLTTVFPTRRGLVRAVDGLHVGLGQADDELPLPPLEFFHANEHHYSLSVSCTKHARSGLRPPQSRTLVMVRERGLEPLQVSLLDPKSSASTSSATFALACKLVLLLLE